MEFCRFGIWLCRGGGQVGMVGFGEHGVGMPGWLLSISGEMAHYDEALAEVLWSSYC